MTVAVRLEGLTSYAAAHALQQRLVALRAEDAIEDVILLLEHPETITLGRHRASTESVLAAGDVPVVAVERGGNATWHAPGQLVAYPLVRLEGDRRDLRGFLRGLEDGIIEVLEGAGLRPTRDPRNTGVWLPSAAEPRKVCSMGIACRRWVTWHGLALNVDVELAGFGRIRPCGFGAEVMTRLADELHPCPPLETWVEPVAAALVRSLSLSDLRWMRATVVDDEVDAVVEAVRSR